MFQSNTYVTDDKILISTTNKREPADETGEYRKLLFPLLTFHLLSLFSALFLTFFSRFPFPLLSSSLYRSRKSNKINDGDSELEHVTDTFN